MRKRKNACWFGIIALIMIISQPSMAQKEKYHSIFIYNFSKYVKWPANTEGSNFVIGVYGKSPILSSLKSMASSKKVNGKPIEIAEFDANSNIENCHILYVSSSESGQLRKIIEDTKNTPVLIITDTPGLATQGAAINFVEVDGKIKFELNQKTAESKGLKVSSSLSSLAILV